MYDYLIIGAGISGASAGYELAGAGTVLLLEAESAPGYHSTGRSAALFTRNYGDPVVRRIIQASHDFFLNPPDGFCEQPLLSPRGALTIAAPGSEAGLEAVLALSTTGHEIEKLSAAQALELAPLLRPERVALAAFEQGVTDIDVSGLHQGYLRGFRQRGGVLLCHARVTTLERIAGGWRVRVGDQHFTARVVINAAGAWAGQTGTMAGAKDIGIVARRRTAVIVDAPADLLTGTMPAVDFVGSDAYLKPDTGRIMASPGDATPCEPQDVQPDDYDVAVLADWLETETLIKVRRIASRWAGLRTFVPDGRPVVGFDPSVEGFFWLAGQGGYGIMMAPALARATAGLILTGTWPRDLSGGGISLAEIGPGRSGLARAMAAAG